MQNKPNLDDSSQLNPTESQQPPAASKKLETWSAVWLKLLWMGLGEKFLRIGSVIVTLILLCIVLWIMGNYYLGNKPDQTAVSEMEDQKATVVMDAVLPYFNPAFSRTDLMYTNEGIFRFSQNHTDLPAKPRSEVIAYQVEANDTVIGIAEKYNLSPSTILWGNPYTLADNPHALTAGMTLNILPVDGVYYEWHDGDGLNGVSEVYDVTPESIINFPGNKLSAETIGDYSHPNITAGTWLVVPGGSREFINWSAPFITRENPAVASIYGPGACEAVMDGPLGSGVFIWPTTETWISGYDYSPETNHRAIDIYGSLGNAVYAADAGVVVYAGWNDWGYGNVVMIDHGNGWQTLYAHLDTYNVQCGYYVFSGDVIGGVGSTGNSSGPHLHYEMRYNGVAQNPHNFYSN
ncbi:MAG: LysM peptidoglycan-binding domain-containing M23 family metallopeptidase [Flexilinea sp.]